MTVAALPRDRPALSDAAPGEQLTCPPHPTPLPPGFTRLWRGESSAPLAAARYPRLSLRRARLSARTSDPPLRQVPWAAPGPGPAALSPHWEGDTLMTTGCPTPREGSGTAASSGVERGLLEFEKRLWDTTPKAAGSTHPAPTVAWAGWWETSEFQAKPDAGGEMPAAPGLRGRAVRADSILTLPPEMVGPEVCCVRAPSTETESEEETGTAPGRPENVIAFPIRRWGSFPRDMALGKGSQLSPSFQGTLYMYFFSAVSKAVSAKETLFLTCTVLRGDPLRARL